MDHKPDVQALLPVDIELRQGSKVLHLGFADGASFDLDFEYLRVFSPSAEVKGHGPGQETLQTGKRGVNIVALEPIGHYALKPTFSDGHDTGLYTWAYLRELGESYATKWPQYLLQLQEANASRDFAVPSASSVARAGCH